MGAYDSLIKRANKIIEKAASKVHSSVCHLVDNEADISNLKGLVIILHPDTSTRARISTETAPEPPSEDITEK